MGRTRMLCRLALAGGATLLALTSCSSGSNTTASSTTSAATTSSRAAATTSSAASAADAAFCAQAQAIANEVNATVDVPSPQRIAQTLPELVSQLKAVTPPPAIAADWQQAVSAVQELAQDFQGVNLSDPQQLQQLEQKAQSAEGRLLTAGQNIESYVSTKCGAAAGSS